MEQVSWDDAQKFLKKLNRMEKTDTYRLPTEAEWEYACRAGSVGEFCFGDDAANWKNMPGMTKIRQARPIRWANCSPMPGASTICTAMSGNGARTGTGHMPLGRWLIPKGLMPDRAGCCGAVPGAAFQGSAFGRSHNNYPDYRLTYVGFRVARTL